MLVSIFHWKELQVPARIPSPVIKQKLPKIHSGHLWRKNSVAEELFGGVLLRVKEYILFLEDLCLDDNLLNQCSSHKRVVSTTDTLRNPAAQPCLRMECCTHSTPTRAMSSNDSEVL